MDRVERVGDDHERRVRGRRQRQSEAVAGAARELPRPLRVGERARRDEPARPQVLRDHADDHAARPATADRLSVSGHLRRPDLDHLPQHRRRLVGIHVHVIEIAKSDCNFGGRPRRGQPPGQHRDGQVVGLLEVDADGAVAVRARHAAVRVSAGVPRQRAADRRRQDVDCLRLHGGHGAHVRQGPDCPERVRVDRLGGPQPRRVGIDLRRVDDIGVDGDRRRRPALTELRDDARLRDDGDRCQRDEEPRAERNRGDRECRARGTAHHAAQREHDAVTPAHWCTLTPVPPPARARDGPRAGAIGAWRVPRPRGCG